MQVDQKRTNITRKSISGKNQGEQKKNRNETAEDKNLCVVCLDLLTQSRR